MSRIGRKPVVVPANVKVSLNDSTINVEGPKGKLSLNYRREIGVKYDEAAKQLLITRPDDERLNRALHGLTRSLIANMVQGVTAGYTKKLEIVGVGYQARLEKANTVALQVGYANQVILEAPAGVTVTVPDATHVVVAGADKQAVGQFAAEIRKVRPPSLTRGRASDMKVKPSAARQARHSGRSNRVGHPPQPSDPMTGLCVRSVSDVPEPQTTLREGLRR